MSSLERATRLSHILGSSLDEIFDPTSPRSWMYADESAAPPNFGPPMPHGQLRPREDVWRVLRRSLALTGKWVTAPTPLVVNGVVFTDMMQGSFSSCTLLSTLASVAWVAPLLIDGTMTITANQVTLICRDGVTLQMTADIPGDNTTITGARSPTNPANEGWPSLWEKAWVMRQPSSRNSPNPYAVIGSGIPLLSALDWLVAGAVVKPFDAAAWADLAAHTDPTTGRIAVIAVADSMGGDVEPYKFSLSKNHAYSVLGMLTVKGVELLIVHDPFQVVTMLNSQLSAAYATLRTVPFWDAICDTTAGIVAVPKKIALDAFPTFGFAPAP